MVLQVRARAVLASAGAVLGLLALPVQADYVRETAAAATAECGAGPLDTSTRTGMIRAGASYPQWHVRHDVSQLHLTDDVVRIENANVTATDLQTICGNTPIFLGETDLVKKWPVVTADGWVNGFFVTTSMTVPTYFAGRFHVRNGLVDRIEEVIYPIDVSGVATSDDGVLASPTERVERFFEADDVSVGYTNLRNGLGDVEPPRRAPARAVRRAVDSYLTAFATRSVDGVLLARDVRRLENLRTRGTSADEVKEQLEAPSMSVKGLRDVVVDIEGENAVAHYRYDVDGAPVSGITRFKVVGGLITQIESICNGGALAPEPGQLPRPFCGDTRSG